MCDLLRTLICAGLSMKNSIANFNLFIFGRSLSNVFSNNDVAKNGIIPSNEYRYIANFRKVFELLSLFGEISEKKLVKCKNV